VRARRWIDVLVVAGTLLVAVAALYERWVLSRLAGTPDPDAGRDFAFPARSTRCIATPDGGSLHVEECGEGRPIVLLHGHGATLGTFALLAGRLAAGGHRVIGVDQRGFGQSSPAPPAFDYRGLVGDVAHVLETLDLHHVIVVGHSMGGAVALGLPIHHPRLASTRVSALVLVSSTARGPADEWRNRVQVAALDRPALELFSRHPRHGVVLARANFGAWPSRSHVEAARVIGLASPVERRKGFARRLLGVDLTEHLAGVELPVLAVTGSSDRVIPVRESKRLAELLPRARLEVLPHAGHMLPMERCEELAKLVLRFADEIDPVGCP
jgi:pimeloyl-ACP methyl ester carboxylesterase